MTIVHHEFYGTNYETLRIRAIVSFLTIEGEEKRISTNIIDLYSIFTHANHSINCYLIRSSNSGKKFLRALQVTRGVNSSRSIVVISLGCVGKTTLQRYFTVFSAHLHMPIWFIHLLQYRHVSYFRSNSTEYDFKFCSVSASHFMLLHFISEVCVEFFIFNSYSFRLIMVHCIPNRD